MTYNTAYHVDGDRKRYRREYYLRNRGPVRVTRDRACTTDGCTTLTGYSNRTGLCSTHYVAPRSDAPEYHAAHGRLYRARGKASSHQCVACGKQANEWAYQHNDPNELISKHESRAYSLDLSRYEPMCHACHVILDRRTSAN